MFFRLFSGKRNRQQKDPTVEVQRLTGLCPLCTSFVDLRLLVDTPISVDASMPSRRARLALLPHTYGEEKLPCPGTGTQPIALSDED